MLSESKVMLNIPCIVRVGAWGIGKKKRVLNGEFVEEHEEFYLFRHPQGYKECFLKTSVGQKGNEGISIKY